MSTPRHHPRFDLESALRQCSLDEVRRQIRAYVEQRAKDHPEDYADPSAIDDHIRLMEPGGAQIIAPIHIAVVEQLRRELHVRSAATRVVPIDVMIWAAGEPALRWGPKLGGVPYRPSGAGWPMQAPGKPLSFIGQICFADSADILPPSVRRAVKDDVLLIFGACHAEDSSMQVDCYACCYEPGAFYTEWQTIGLEVPLNVEVPAEVQTRPVAHAQLLRTEDFDGVPDDHPVFHLKQGYLIDCLQGGKIGGLANYVQNDIEDACFLAALGSVRSTESDPLSGDRGDRSYVMFDDMGCLYFVVNADGDLEWDMQGY